MTPIEKLDEWIKDLRQGAGPWSGREHAMIHRLRGLTMAIELYCPDIKTALTWAETYAEMSKTK